MKLEKLLLDDNNQTGEALKHVYTTLLINDTIELSIDFPLITPVDSDERSIETDFERMDSDSEDSNEDKKKILQNTVAGSVAPLLRQGTTASKS